MLLRPAGTLRAAYRVSRCVFAGGQVTDWPFAAIPRLDHDRESDPQIRRRVSIRIAEAFAVIPMPTGAWIVVKPRHVSFGTP